MTQWKYAKGLLAFEIHCVKDLNYAWLLFWGSSLWMRFLDHVKWKRFEHSVQTSIYMQKSFSYG